MLRHLPPLLPLLLHLLLLLLQTSTALPAAPDGQQGPPELPSQFLREAIAGFLDRLRLHQATVAELEQVLLLANGSGGAAGAERAARVCRCSAGLRRRPAI